MVGAPHRVGGLRACVVITDQPDPVGVAAVDAQPQAAGHALDRPSGTTSRNDGEEGEVEIGVMPLPPARGHHDGLDQPRAVRPAPVVISGHELDVDRVAAGVDAVRRGHDEVLVLAVHDARGAEVRAGARGVEECPDRGDAAERRGRGRAGWRAGVLSPALGCGGLRGGWRSWAVACSIRDAVQKARVAPLRRRADDVHGPAGRAGGPAGRAVLRAAAASGREQGHRDHEREGLGHVPLLIRMREMINQRVPVMTRTDWPA